MGSHVISIYSHMHDYESETQRETTKQYEPQIATRSLERENPFLLMSVYCLQRANAHQVIKDTSILDAAAMHGRSTRVINP